MTFQGTSKDKIDPIGVDREKQTEFCMFWAYELLHIRIWLA